jgi:hypothetical protein
LGPAGAGDEFVRLLAQRIEHAGNVVEADPDVAGEQRLLHEIVPGRVRIDALP